MWRQKKKGLRGGICCLARRYSEANNKYIKNYDPTIPSKYIECLYVNNLCGWAISRYLPYGVFKWLKNVDNFDVNWVSKNSSIGYILKVDLEYPEKLHLLPSDCPLAQEKLTIPYAMLLDCCTKIADEYEIKIGDVKKINSKFGSQN